MFTYVSQPCLLTMSVSTQPNRGRFQSRGHSAYQPKALPLGRTGSRGDSVMLALGMCLDLVLEC